MSYIRLHVTAEGQTEKNFVKRVLEKHLAEYSVFTDCRCVLTSKDNRTGKEYRGGFRRTAAYTTVKKDIQTWLKEDKNPVNILIVGCRFWRIWLEKVETLQQNIFRRELLGKYEQKACY